MAITLEKRVTNNPVWQVFSILIALAGSVLVSALLLKSAGSDLQVAFGAILDGAFGGFRATTKTLAKATPLILTGIAVAVAFRAKIWNIGAEGQLFAGAMTSYWAYLIVGPAPGVYLIPLLFMAGFVGGGLYGGLAGYLRAKFQVNEVLTTVMLNYVITFFLSFMLVSGPWRDQSSFYQQTPRIDKSVWLPNLLDSGKLHIGFAVAVFCAVAIYVMLTRTSLGYEIRAVGMNPRASRFKGINIQRTAVLVMLLSGGLAGLAGVIEVFGVHHRLKPDVSVGFGFTGIIVAVLAMLNPLAVVPVAILFGAFANGGIKMQIATGVPNAITSAIEAIVLLFFLAAAALTRFKIVWRDKNG